MKVGVFGSASSFKDELLKEKARLIGEELAKRNHTVITGGCPGAPYVVALGAKEAGGKTIAFSPATDLESHVQKYGLPKEGFDEFVFVPEDYVHKDSLSVCYKYRNVSSVAASDCAIVIMGRIGTMNEFTIAYDLSKPIGVLKGSRGITENAIPVLLRDASKPTQPEIIFESDPVLLVEKLEKIFLKKGL